MKSVIKYSLCSKVLFFNRALPLLFLIICSGSVFAQDDIELIYPITDPLDPSQTNTGIMDLNNPSNIFYDVVYDPVTGQYVFTSTVGDEFDYLPPSSMTLDEYVDYNMENSMQTYWMEKMEAENLSDHKGLIPQIKVGGKTFEDIFGSNTIDIRPQGSAELSFGINVSKTENPRIPVRQRRITTFDFDQRIQLNVIGNIGEKLKLTTNYNTEATFDFENQVKLDYTGFEDEIIQRIEAGNVSLPLNGSLIQGSQSLFGIKTELRFGRLTATALFSQEKGQRSEIAVSGGAQTSNFEVKADEYEANRHYLVNYLFRENYENAVATLPTVNSGIQITRMEVWVTNTQSNFEQNRNIIGFVDLGESPANTSPDLIIGPGPEIYPDNDHNDLYATISADPNIRGFINSTSALQGLGLQAAKHYEKLESARMLTQNEYTFNSKLGFISLNQSLNNDEVLGVAYQYTFQGNTYQVGEFSTDGIAPPDALMLKLLKATITDPKNPMWDLMMKNIYALGAFQLNSQNFYLEILYNDPAQGVDINYIPRPPVDGKPLLQVMSMDRLDQNLQPGADGVFDFVDGAQTNGGTINSQNGRVFFTVLEPFGSHLDGELIGPDPNNPVLPDAVRSTIVYQQLYDSTKTSAQNFPELNRFKMKGSYQGASSDVISLNAINIPQGSVSVTAGGVRLVENQDYTVDYNLGRVKILNQGILESGTPINIQLESNTLFSIQTKTLMGARFDYQVNKDFILGGTILNLHERPLTQKTNVGDEPISNTIWGLDADYRTKAPFITRAVDALPFIDTKEESNINLSGEFAHLIPGHSKAIGKDGTSYIDDFEGSVSTIDLRTQSQWFISSTPQGQLDLFPEGNLINDLSAGYNRAQLSWYIIDPLFFRDNNLTPANITNTMQSDNRMREVLEQEVFPNRQLPTGTPANIPVLDLAYYPKERGQYNYNPDLTSDGELQDPEDSWAGITRKITTTDFEASNIEVIQFWVMDPFHSSTMNSEGEPATNVDSENINGGDLYINLGNISEDVMHDSRKSFENGLPKDLDDLAAVTAETEWGIVPTTQSVVNAFAITQDNSYKYQDVGIDGLSDQLQNIDGQTEQSFYQDYLDALDPGALAIWEGDPSADNFHYFRGSDYDSQGLDILERYKKFNGLEGNSVTQEDSPESYPTSATTLPSTEDLNQDQNLSESESYFQYKIPLKPENMVVGQGFITDRILATANTPDGPKQVYWYQFKVPVRLPEKVVNGIQDFRSIRFMRMYMKGWTEPVVMRFARLEFVRGEWRKYNFSLETPGEGLGGDPDQTIYETAAVNIEENGNRDPINYVLPPGINQEVDVSSSNLRNLNEQSLQLFTCGLRDGDARASYRNVGFDIRAYKKLKMFIHAESADPDKLAEFGDVSVFIRLGNDFNENYYEYEVPVVISALYDNDPYSVWPEANDMELDFASLTRMKIQRDQAGYSKTLRYLQMDGNRRMFVRGNPNLSDMKSIMIGIRNPKKDGQEKNPWDDDDDGVSQCVEVWVNELRLSDFDESGGWATIARMNASLADLGNLSVAGNYSTPGFGSIDQKVGERQRETKMGVDASTNLALGKFFPEKTGIKIPMYLGFSKQLSNPQYDPLNPDIKFEDATRGLTDEERREQKKLVQDVTERRSMNFTNVRKERTNRKGKEHFYDVENLALSYSYNDVSHRDVNLEYDDQKNYSGGLTYNHNPSPKLVKPFQNLSKSQWLKLLTEFNFYTGLKQVNFSSDIDRSYAERLVRQNTDFVSLPSQPTYTKQFNWNSAYNIRWELTKSLKVDFSVNNNAIITEPEGKVDKNDQESHQIWKDSVMSSIREFGTVMNYNHTVNINYQLPLDKFPMTDWLSVNTSYMAGYQWDRAPLTQDSLGNTIQNSQNISINGQINFVNLYNKIGFMKKINDKGRGGGRRPAGRTPAGSRGGEDQDKDKKKDPNKLTIGEGFVRLIMSIRNGSLTYTQNSGILLPGYNGQTNIIGMDPGFDAPGFGFIMGQQNHNFFGDPVRDFAQEAANKDWMVKTPSIFTPHTTTRSETINARLNVEPVRDLRIELTANKTLGESSSEFFRWNTDSMRYVSDSPQENGNFSISTITWGTAFRSDDKNFVNETFEQLLVNREVISERLGMVNDDSFTLEDSAYWYGYGATNQDVIIPAFVAAYTGRSAEKVELNPFKMIPLPNWDLTYDGLTRIALFKRWFRTVTIGHSYRSTFNISRFQTNLEYVEGQNNLDAAGNFIPERQMTVITIAEQMSPLINFDATLNNSLIAKVELRRDRNLSLSLSNYQVTEVRGVEWVIGTGYRFQNVKFPFAIGGKAPVSNLNLRADLSIRDNRTVIRKMQENQNQVTSGQEIISIKVSADYVINQKLNIRFFYDRVVNNPLISTSFPTANTNAGISLRFTLSQ